MHEKDLNINLDFSYETYCTDRKRCVRWSITRPNDFKMDKETAEAVMVITEDFLRVFKNQYADLMPKKEDQIISDRKILWKKGGYAD